MLSSPHILNAAHLVLYLHSALIQWSLLCGPAANHTAFHLKMCTPSCTCMLRPYSFLWERHNSNLRPPWVQLFIGINRTVAHAQYEAAIFKGMAVPLRTRPQRKDHWIRVWREVQVTLTPVDAALGKFSLTFLVTFS